MSENYNSELMDESQSSDNIEGADEGELSIDTVDSRKDVILNKCDRSLHELHSWYKDGDLKIDPEWQRQYVWNLKKASKLIESFICDIPIPVIYLAEDRQGSYEVIDGLQRLTSVFNFFEGEYPLSALDIIPDFNRLKFKDLPVDIQKKLKKTTIRTFELGSATSKELKFIIFERLNTGGVALNDMEIRNCLYRGKLNELIKTLAKNEDFISSINQKQIHLRMADRGLILRFLAFYEKTHLKSRSGLKRFLNDFLETYRDPSEEKIAEYEKIFKKCMRACFTVFGEYSFRLLQDNHRKNTEWAGRPNAAIFQVIASSFSDYDLSQITRAADSIREEYLDLIFTDEKWVDYVRRATGEFTRLDYVFSEWKSRLAAVMQDFPKNDSQRIYSQKLKNEIFDQDPNCKICQQRIVLLRDAAMDHDLHYWRGGQTIPENARLVHRICNLSRSK